MKKFVRVIVCLMAAMLFVMAPLEGFAARTLEVYKVTANQVRVHSTTSSGTTNVKGKVNAGTKVFLLDTSSGWCKVRTDHGLIGYIWKDYLSYIGSTTQDKVYESAYSNVWVFKKASYNSSRVATLGYREHVILSSTSNGWARVLTVNGKKGYVRTNEIKKAK